jgi:hypothetical protein
MTFQLISPHYMLGNDKGENYSKLAAPPIVKLVDAFADADKIAALPHKPLLIGRMTVTPDDWWKGRSPTNAVNWLFGACGLEQQIKNNPAITYWETINEPVISDGLSLSDKAVLMTWLDMFQELCAFHLRALGKKLIAFNFSVGNPDRALWQYATRTLKLTQTQGVIIGLHRYLELVKTPAGQVDYSATVNGDWGGYHLLDIADFAELGYTPPIAITEAGLERIGNGLPWKLSGISDFEYATIMNLWGLRLAQSPQILGACLFTTGGPAGWKDYDIGNTQVEKHLINYANSNTRPTAPILLFTNQDMFNLVYRVTKKPVGMVIPADVLAMMGNRQAEYRGPKPSEWGATPAQLAMIEKGMV